jgi:hypothetical protein
LLVLTAVVKERRASADLGALDPPYEDRVIALHVRADDAAFDMRQGVVDERRPSGLMWKVMPSNLSSRVAMALAMIAGESS